MAIGTPAQQFLAIETIREDVVILKEGGIRAILMCSSLNFALKSPEEQDATIFQFQNLLNSLDFPIQIVVESRKLDISPYLASLAERQKEEDNELLKVQINEYIEFIKTFVQMSNIMSKTFYVVVPFTPTALEQKGGWGAFTKLFGGAKTQDTNNADSLAEYKHQLWQRVDTVIAGLQRCGVRAVPLNTEELIELFYGLYNPTELEKTIGVSG